MISNKLLDLLRRGRSAHEKHLIDGLIRGAVSRREFLRYGSVLGLSALLPGGITGGAGLWHECRPSRAGTPGGTIRFGQIVPAATVTPVPIADGGGITVLSQGSETLVFSAPDLTA